MLSSCEETASSLEPGETSLSTISWRECETWLVFERNLDAEPRDRSGRE